MTWFRWMLLFVIAIIIVYGVRCARSVKHVLEHINNAEIALHDGMVIGEVVGMYVVDHQGQWPRSWDDLLIYEQKGSIHSWPQDVDEIKLAIEINFNLELDSALQNVDSVWLIRDRGEDGLYQTTFYAVGNCLGRIEEEGADQVWYSEYWAKAVASGFGVDGLEKRNGH